MLFGTDSLLLGSVFGVMVLATPTGAAGRIGSLGSLLKVIPPAEKINGLGPGDWNSRAP